MNNNFLLLHVTNIENIENILLKGLKYSVCKETYVYRPQQNIDEPIIGEFYIPMVSFFGMTLDEFKQYRQTYGNCAIIFNYEKLKINQFISPVRYINEYSYLTENTICVFEEMIKEKSSKIESACRNRGEGFEAAAIRQSFLNLIYTKSFTGELYRWDKSKQNYQLKNKGYHFGLEREWRIIPKGLKKELDIIFKKGKSFTNEELNISNKLLTKMYNQKKKLAAKIKLLKAQDKTDELFNAKAKYLQINKKFSKSKNEYISLIGRFEKETKEIRSEREKLEATFNKESLILDNNNVIGFIVYNKEDENKLKEVLSRKRSDLTPEIYII